MAKLHVTNESPTKITLEMDPAWKAETSKTFAESIKQGRGCIVFITIAFLVIFAILGYSIYNNSLGSLPWSFWLCAAIVLAGGGVFIFFEAYFWLSEKNEADEITVTIDLDSQRAVRVEKSKAGRTTQKELKLEQVTQVLIHGDDAGHRLELTLESKNNPPFEVNSDVFIDPQLLIDQGRKLGALIKKPVVFKITDGGKPFSEETVQA